MLYSQIHMNMYGSLLFNSTKTDSSHPLNAYVTCRRISSELSNLTGLLFLGWYHQTTQAFCSVYTQICFWLYQVVHIWVSTYQQWYAVERCPHEHNSTIKMQQDDQFNNQTGNQTKIIYRTKFRGLASSTRMLIHKILNYPTHNSPMFVVRQILLHNCARPPSKLQFIHLKFDWFDQIALGFFWHKW